MNQTKEEFWQALMRAYSDLFITYDEAVAAYRKFVYENTATPHLPEEKGDQHV